MSKKQQNQIWMNWRQFGSNGIQTTRNLGFKYCFFANNEHGSMNLRIGKFSMKKMIAEASDLEPKAVFFIRNNENELHECLSLAEALAEKNVGIVIYAGNIVRTLDEESRCKLFADWFSHFKAFRPDFAAYGFPSHQFRDIIKMFLYDGQLAIPHTQCNILPVDGESKHNPNCEPGLCQEKVIQKWNALFHSQSKDAKSYPWDFNGIPTPEIKKDQTINCGIGISMEGEPWDGFTWKKSIDDQIEASNLAGVNKFFLNWGENVEKNPDLMNALMSIKR